MSRSYSVSDPSSDEWEYDFLGNYVADPVRNRGRKYYKAVTARRLSDNLQRIYNVGDPVVLNSGSGALWVAQLLNLFEEAPEEYQARGLSDDLLTDHTDHTYMRCTLRWFEAPADIPPEARKMSKVPRPYPDEIYFSDHVEDDGFNSIAEIKGMAFLLPSVDDSEAFYEEPDPRYIPELDRVCLVRGFANSSADKVIRLLDDGELEFLLKNPCSDRRLHDTSIQRLYESTQVYPTISV